MSEGYPQPLERNGCQRRPSMRVVSVFLLIRMGDRGGFNKFGGKWQKKQIKQTQRGWNEYVKAKGGWWGNSVCTLINVSCQTLTLPSVSGLQVRTFETLEKVQQGGVVVLLDLGCIIKSGLPSVVVLCRLNPTWFPSDCHNLQFII